MTPAWCSEYIGIRFQEHGRDRAGLDCWGLARLVLAERFGLADLPDYGERYTRTSGNMAQRELAAIFEAELPASWTRVQSPAAGDIAVYRLHGRPMHVGLVVSTRWMLSIERGVDSALERLDSARWLGRLDGYYRHAQR